MGLQVQPGLMTRDKGGGGLLLPGEQTETKVGYTNVKKYLFENPREAPTHAHVTSHAIFHMKYTCARGFEPVTSNLARSLLIISST
jgi:hypothetical protein